MAILSPNMNVMIKAVEKASKTLLRDYGEVENLQVSIKGPGDFVTAADKKAEQTIYDELLRARPSYGFLLEEGGEIVGEDPDHRWIVDPLDGTQNFLHGIPHWCISIALEKNDEIIAAVIYNPVTDEIFRAEKGTGAFSRNKRLRVSGRGNLKDCMVVSSGMLPNYKHHDKAMALASKITKLAAGYRVFGASALDLAHLAAGKIDAFYEYDSQLKPWDKAAGYLIVKEAGGFCQDRESNNVVYGKKILAGNLKIRADMEKILKSA